MHSFCLWLFSSTIALSSAPAAAEELCRVWQDRTYEVPFPRGYGEIVYDSWRDVIVFVGRAGYWDGNAWTYQNETWEWNGKSWTKRTADGPGGYIAFDETRGVVVLISQVPAGLTSQSLATWEWDGIAWHLRSATGPPLRSNFDTVFDPIRGEVLLFGGEVERQPLNDLWSWNGTEWHQIESQGGPARYSHNLAYDSARDVLLVLGGERDRWSWSNEIWEWNRTSWTLNPAPLVPMNPNTVAFHKARSETVLLDHDNILWALGDAGWSPLCDSNERSANWGYQRSLAYDSKRQALISYGYDGRDDADLLAFDNSSWKPLAGAGPSPRFLHSMAYDAIRAEVILFGGRGHPTYMSDTWTWNGSTWNLAAIEGPSPRQSAAMAFDSFRGMTVLFGGRGPEPDDVTAHCCSLDGTWEWDGTLWRFFDVVGPGKRHSHSMAYDEARGVTLLFGGYFQAVYPANDDHAWNDTWTWDGTAWTELTVAGPPPLSRQYMAYDPRRGVIVLFGGVWSIDALEPQTWEWDGSKWTKRNVTCPPVPYGAVMYFDPLREQIVLSGGGASDPDSAGVWEWDGVRWRIAGVTLPPERLYAAVAYDDARECAVLFGGIDVNGIWRKDTWEYEVGSLPADCDSDCDVDLLDFAVLQTCVGDMSADAACAQLDVDGSGWVDAADFAELFAMPTGPSEPSD